jgi:CheY-like chemotaxis protein
VNQKVTVAMLEKLGFCADVVDNGVEAVIAATMVPYRAILMDCEIPVLNGYETTSEIRTQSGASRESPIIAVTSASSELDQQRCLAAGMDGHLTKPLTLGTLSAGLSRWAPMAESSVAPDRELTAISHRNQGQDHDEPALDAVVLDRLERLGAEAGEDLVGELATLFLADAETRIVALHDALARLDGPALMHCGALPVRSQRQSRRRRVWPACVPDLATDGTVGDPETGEVLLHSVETELARDP